VTALDGWSADGLGAVAIDAGGRPQGVGAARWVRDAQDPTTAEFALLVVDGWQGCGLGMALLTRLATVAVQRGIARFTGYVLPDNAPMFDLLDKYAPVHQRSSDRDFVTVTVPLAPYVTRAAA